MATKDWKKTDNSSEPNMMAYVFRKKNSNIMVIVDRVHPGYFQKRKIILKWKAQISNPWGSPVVQEEKKFKTKPQAMKYAKAYMRKH